MKTRGTKPLTAKQRSALKLLRTHQDGEGQLVAIGGRTRLVDGEPHVNRQTLEALARRGLVTYGPAEPVYRVMVA